MRDRIVVGLRDSELSEKLQLISDLTLEAAVSRARQSESVKTQQKVVREEINIDQLHSPPSPSVSSSRRSKSLDFKAALVNTALRQMWEGSTTQLR